MILTAEEITRKQFDRVKWKSYCQLRLVPAISQTLSSRTTSNQIVVFAQEVTLVLPFVHLLRNVLFKIKYSLDQQMKYDHSVGSQLITSRALSFSSYI